MPFAFQLEEGERLIAQLSFVVPGDSSPFHIAVSERALFLPKKKLFAVKDPTYCERVSLNRVTDARIKKLHPFFFWLLSMLMVLVGSITTVLMILPLIHREDAHLSGYPPAVAVVGLVIPFIIRQRFGLSISIVNEPFLWKPRLLVDRASREAVGTFLTQAADAFREAGIHVIDERTGLSPALHSTTKPFAYPVALPGTDPGPGIVRNCFRCGTVLKISRWDDWNGFLYRCPHCNGIYGKPWRPFAILLLSLVLNALSFFLTLRWKAALPLLLAFALLASVVRPALNRGQLSPTLEDLIMGMFLLGPLIINSVLVLRHEMALKTATVLRRE
jgi:hypothetical protein